MNFFRDYSSYPPKVRRIMMIRDVFAAVCLLAIILSLILHLCGFHTAEELILDIIRTAILIIAVVGVLVFGIITAVNAFREKRIGTGIFLAVLMLTIPTGLLVLYIL